MLPRGEEEYEYEIDWIFRGNRKTSSGRQRTDSTILFVDDLPES